MASVPRETCGTHRRCSGLKGLNCRNRARRGQRYCHDCHAKAQAAYRARQKADQRTQAWELHTARLALEVAAWGQR